MSIETQTLKRASCDHCGKQTQWVDVEGETFIFMRAIAALGWEVVNGWETLLCPTCVSERPAADPERSNR